MTSEVHEWLSELRAEKLDLSDSGADENLWRISLPDVSSLGVEELVHFLRQAVSIRRELASAQQVSPATFYVWHDEMAGQLRFSTVPSPPDHLPFRAEVELVATPEEVVSAFLDSSTREAISAARLGLTGFADNEERYGVRVWAERLT